MNGWVVFQAHHDLLRHLMQTAIGGSMALASGLVQ